MNATKAVGLLENAWDLGGFLGRLREGVFHESDAVAFVEMLRSVSIGDNEPVPKRLLVLVWYMPLFLDWQKDRIAEVSGVVSEYERFVTEVINVLEEVVGVP